MLDDYFEHFTLLCAVSFPDPFGGQVQQETFEIPFSAALADALGEEGERAGKPFVRVTPFLLCAPEIPLALGDIIRREKTGARYRVCTRPEDRRTPLGAGFPFCEVQLERLEADA